MGNPRWPLVCTNCRRLYPKDSLPYRCPHCGGIYDFEDPFSISLAGLSRDHVEGIGRFRDSFPLANQGRWVSLGEGSTPLVSLEREGRTVHFKCEGCNPTGSFKDRGSAVLVSALFEAGIDQVIEDSSGNAGSSLAAYAARAGIKARIFVPEYASGPKRAQIEAYGAELVPIPGQRVDVAEAAHQAAQSGIFYASHAYLPHGLAGMATIAYEIFEQLGSAPEAVVVPVGQGTLLLGMWRGFQALQRAGWIEEPPRLVGVQALACAPLYAVFTTGATGLGMVREGETLAEGIRILNPLRGDAILKAVADSGGWMEAVDEAAIRTARNALGASGLYVEPTSAVVWAARDAVFERISGEIVMVLTGSGLKSP
ncbi:MAG: pyridoxal-phosphate dependent enzyme [Anaerolineales bacterium]